MAHTDWESIVGKDGRTELMRFQFEMIKIRASIGWTHKDLRSALKKLANNTNPETGSLYWQMANTQEWCRVLGGKLLITYDNMPTPDADEVDATVQQLKALFLEDEFERWMAVRLLAQSRIAAGISIREMGAKIGLTGSAVGNWEQNTPNPMIPSLMRHAYALGGTVRLDFVPVEPVKGPAGRR